MAIWRPGMRMTAARLNRTQPSAYYAGAGSILTPDSTYRDIPGCQLTITTQQPQARYVVTGHFDTRVSTAAGGFWMLGSLVVDGTRLDGVALMNMNQTGGTSPSEAWSGTLPSAGSHTFTMQGQRQGGSGGCTFDVNSRLVVTIYEAS